MKSFRIKFVFTTMVFILTFKVTFSQCNETNCLGYYQENNSSAIITHYHDTSIGGNCIGYAIAETQQSYLGPICGQTKSISISESYAKNYWMTWGFYNKFTFTGYVQSNDILIWDNHPDDINMNLRHAAVVNYTGSGYISFKYIDSDLADNTVHNGTLESSKNFVDSNYGRPAYVVRRNSNIKTYGYCITLKTSFNGGTLKIDGTTYNINGSNSVLIKNLSSGPHTLEADDRQYNGTAWVGYKEWLNKSNQPIATDPVRSKSITLNYSNGFGETYTANYVPFYNVTIQNSYTGISYNGKVIINDGPPTDAPQIKEVKKGNSIKVEIPLDEKDYIKFQFDHWQDQITQNPRTFNNILGDLNLTAYYKGKPSTANRNLQRGNTVGAPIYLSWNEHPNTYVTQYRIWRQVKHNGVLGTAVQIATKNRGTLSYTDYDYSMTNGYTDDLLFYDVRPYYSLDNTTSDPSWLPIYGEPFAKILDTTKTVTKILENLIINYPNPFNPSTIINYAIKDAGLVSIKVYDILGAEVATLINETKEAGEYAVEFNASTLPSGVYIYNLQAGDFVSSKKMILIK